MLTRALHVACLFLVAAFWGDASTIAANSPVLYVAPEGNDQAEGRSRETAFRSLEKARDAIRELRKADRITGPVKVLLGGGTHVRAEPLVLTPEDSGSPESPVTWAAVPGEQPVVSGGRRIEGWTRHEGNIWKVDLPQVRDGKWWFRQLFVDGQLRRRARTPNDGFQRVAGFPEGTSKTVHYHTDCKSFEYAEGDIDPAWTNIDRCRGNCLSLLDRFSSCRSSRLILTNGSSHSLTEQARYSRMTSRPTELATSSRMCLKDSTRRVNGI